MNPLPTLMRLLARLDPYIDHARLVLYGWTFVGLYVAIAVVWVWVSVDYVDPRGKPLGYDFITFYSAAKLALAGNPLAAFDLQSIYAEQKAALPSNAMPFLWHYPPTYLLAVLPLGVLSYFWAYFTFVLGTLALLLLFARCFEDRRIALLLALAFPATFINFFHGQNAFLTTALLGFGLLLVEKRPVLAGICIGLLAIKPHVAILVPFAFAAVGHWRAFVTAGVVAVGFCLAATWTFGMEYWSVFVGNFHVVSRVLESGWLPWPKMPTVYAAARLLFLPNAIAYALQLASALAMIVLVVRVWLRPGPLDLKAAFLVVATLFVSPYFFDYDLVLLIIPLWALAKRAADGTAEPGTRVALVMVAATPLGAIAIAGTLHIQLMPFAIALLGLLVWRRLAAESAAPRTQDGPVTVARGIPA